MESVLVDLSQDDLQRKKYIQLCVDINKGVLWFLCDLTVVNAEPEWKVPETPIGNAVACGDILLVRALLERGARPEQPNGYSVLEYVTAYTYSNEYERNLDIRIHLIKVLLQFGSTLNDHVTGKKPFWRTLVLAAYLPLLQAVETRGLYTRVPHTDFLFRNDPEEVIPFLAARNVYPTRKLLEQWLAEHLLQVDPPLYWYAHRLSELHSVTLHHSPFRKPLAFCIENGLPYSALHPSTFTGSAHRVLNMYRVLALVEGWMDPRCTTLLRKLPTDVLLMLPSFLY